MKKLRKYRYWLIIPASLVAVLIFSLVSKSLMNQYEQSVLSVYAIQQDAYVQLVLDQINLQDDRSDTEIIEEILGSLDTSSKKYWTLTKEQTLLFVKDVTETNRYKGFTTSTYYVSDSANDFLSELSVNHIVNKIIEIDGYNYVASGVIFEYGGSEYKICLLTNTDVILDNNDFLSTEIKICIYIAILLITLLILIMCFATVLRKKNDMIYELHEIIKSKNIDIDELGTTLRNYNYYNTRQHLFSAALLPKFLKNLEDKKIAPVTVMKISFKDENEKNTFLEKGTVLLDDTILRFYSSDDSLILIFIRGTEEFARKSCDSVCVQYEINNILEYNDVNKSLLEQCRSITENI
ncbi:MAG: hypothetical protein ACI4E1_10675 [Lachnospira sp.]